LERQRDNFAVSEPESYAIMAHLDSRLRITLTSRVDYHWVRPAFFIVVGSKTSIAESCK
ncbi:hypothetical protein THAOC_23723, partial [Thalassiosira oceanica]